jgi:molybdopterin synthase sulfurtransferase
VDVAWVTAQQAGENPAGNPDNDSVILECQWGLALPGSDYARGHVPGAIHADTDDFETGPPAYSLKHVAALTTAVERLGITSGTTVVVYSAWPLAAARCWWILRYLGVEDVRFFEGGLPAWIAAGGAIETCTPAPRPSRPFGKKAPCRADWLVGLPEVEALVEARSATIIDVRSEAEFMGEISGYRSLKARGRIPGALWGQDACAEPGSAYLREDGSLRTAGEIRAIWDPLGVTPDQQTVFYCGGGWRSSLACLYAQLLGLPSARNYSDGWFEWSATHPVEATSG